MEQAIFISLFWTYFVSIKQYSLLWSKEWCNITIIKSVLNFPPNHFYWEPNFHKGHRYWGIYNLVPKSNLIVLFLIYSLIISRYTHLLRAVYFFQYFFLFPPLRLFQLCPFPVFAFSGRQNLERKNVIRFWKR